MANVTRTIKKAYVSYERVFKEDGKVETDYGDITLFKCDRILSRHSVKK